MKKISLTRREFEELVLDTVKSLPREFKRKLENINIVIIEEPSPRQNRELGTRAGEDLLGLYEGVPLGKRTHHDGCVLPDKITIFRGPVMRSCCSRSQIRTAIRDTVIHEFAHYFGISDEHMLNEGTY